MPQFPIWLPALLGALNLVIALFSLWTVRQSRRYFLLADQSRIAAQSALAEVLAMSEAQERRQPHLADPFP